MATVTVWNEYRHERENEAPRSKLDGFVDAIEGTAPVPATTHDAVRATAVSEAAYESAHRGEPMDVEL